VAEVTGAQAPADVDGLSLLPELVGAKAAGRAQPQHEYLYWEINQSTALRQGSWRAVRPKANAAWELYDLTADPGESKDLAQSNPGMLAKLTALAAKAHEPVREGTFTRTDRHQRDQRAKFGQQDDPAAPAGNAKGRKKSAAAEPGVIAK
jgi:arylsulfatase A-like enzyme